MVMFARSMYEIINTEVYYVSNCKNLVDNKIFKNALAM